MENIQFGKLKVMIGDKCCEKEIAVNKINSKLKTNKNTVKQISSLPKKLEEKLVDEKFLAHNLVYLLHDFDEKSIKNKKIGFEGYNSLKDFINDDDLGIKMMTSFFEHIEFLIGFIKRSKFIPQEIKQDFMSQKDKRKRTDDLD
ncbi:6598_t:CDS:2, partial [Gigaspora rosea]